MMSISGPPAPAAALRVRTEEDRIRDAYTRRAQHDRDHDASWFNPYYVYARQERERHVLACLHRLGMPLTQMRILEVGCGTGAWLRDFVRWGVPPDHICGVDLLPEAVAEARTRCPAGIQLECQSVARLTYPDAMFDIVLQSMLFTSLLDHAVRQQAAQEMLRVLAPGGAILWYDFFLNNPWNPDVRRVGRREIRALFPGCQVRLRRTNLAPPLARRIAAWSLLLHQILASVPWLGTHYLGVIRPTTARSADV